MAARIHDIIEEIKALQYIRGKKSVTKSNLTYKRYERISKIMRERPWIVGFLKRFLHASYGTDHLNVQIGLIHLKSIHLFPLEEVKETLCLPEADMKVKNAKQTGRLNTEMFYSEAVALLNDLENEKKARDAKNPTLVEFLEVKVPKGTVKKPLIKQ